jgi:rod shape-determining protein MreC
VPPRRFDQARPFAALGLVLLAWLVVPAALKSLARASFFELTAPVSAAASKVRDLQEYWSLAAHSRQQLIEAGRDLARVNASYDLAAQRNAQLEAEIGTLEQQLRMPPQPGYRFEPARVALRDLSAWWQRLTLLKGRNYGIKVGAPVVFAGGAVGRVSEVHFYTSVVDLISDPSVRLSALIEGDARPVSFEGGDNPTLGPARGAVEYIPLDVTVEPGHAPRLVTSGLGGVFPAGLTIGRLVRVVPSDDGLFKTGVVELDDRLSQLTEVTVLVPEERPAAIAAPPAPAAPAP